MSDKSGSNPAESPKPPASDRLESSPLASATSESVAAESAATARPISTKALPIGAPPTLVGRLDATMAEHPWYPRVAPFLVYLILLAATGAVSARVPLAYPFLYLIQIGIVSWLLWRYRKLLPELNLRFHWLAVPTGVIVFLGWVWLGMLIDEWSHVRRVGLSTFTERLAQWSLDPTVSATSVANGDIAFVSEQARDESVFVQLGLRENAPIAWLAFSLRLLGMAIVVPLFEELFVRSLLLRSFHSARNTFLGVVQVAQDFPVIGDKLMGTRLAEEADKLPPMFEHEFKRVPLGALSVFGVFASTLIFTLSHVPRDYAGCVFCGIAYCLCLYFTRHKGLGPVCWAHGITNALIWLYTLHTDDWRFL